MARSRSKHQRKKMKIRQAWKRRLKTKKKAAAKTPQKPASKAAAS
jgi:hypothetical protein